MFTISFCPPLPFFQSLLRSLSHDTDIAWHAQSKVAGNFSVSKVKNWCTDRKYQTRMQGQFIILHFQLDQLQVQVKARAKQSGALIYSTICESSYLYSKYQTSLKKQANDQHTYLICSTFSYTKSCQRKSFQDTTVCQKQTLQLIAKKRKIEKELDFEDLAKLLLVALRRSA